MPLNVSLYSLGLHTGKIHVIYFKCECTSIAEYLEFVEPMVTLNETVKKARIEVRRRGYLPGGRQIMCKLKAVTATAVQAVPGADLEDADFLVGLKPQTVNFAANESQACKNTT